MAEPQIKTPAGPLDPLSLWAGLVLRLARRLYALKPQAVFLHHIGPLLYGGIAARLATSDERATVIRPVAQIAPPLTRELLLTKVDEMTLARSVAAMAPPPLKTT